MSDDEETGAATTSSGQSKKPTASAYYTWSADKAARNAELTALGVDVRPKAVASGECTPPVVAAAATAGSAWNSAGTWEERDVTARALSHMRSTVSSFSTRTSAGHHILVPAVDKCDGTVTVVFSRGKARPGFEVSLRFDWHLVEHPSSDAPVAKGSVSIDDISDSEGSDIFGRMVVDCREADGPVDKATAKQSVAASTEAIRELLRAWVEAVKLM